jgi:hypothetical protein
VEHYSPHHPRRTLELPERFEGRSHFGHEVFRLFPRREVAALVELVVVDEIWIRLPCPVPWALKDLIWKLSSGCGGFERLTF